MSNTGQSGEAIDVSSRATALALPDEGRFRQDFAAITKFQQIVHASMVRGHDYGVIPGTGNKPTLLKPGAEKIAKLLGLADEYDILKDQEDWERGFFRYLIRCRLVSVVHGVTISQGLGECNSMEAKYRWRWVGERDLPPGVDKAKLITTERRNQTGGRWRVYRVENDDIYSQVNTILKMAKKRALVDAALSAGRLSDLFTQDIEDLSPQENLADDEPPVPPARLATAPPTEHWCEEHQTGFFKRGGMKNYAHPIEGQPRQWCSEPISSNNAPRQAQESKALPFVTPTIPGPAEKVSLQDYPWHQFRKDMDNEIARLPGKDWQVPVVITDPNMGEWVAAASEQLTKLSLNAPDVWVTLFGANPTKGQIVGLNRAIISSLSQFSFDQVAGAIVGLAADREPEETATPFDGTELVFEGDDKGDDKK